MTINIRPEVLVSLQKVFFDIQVIVVDPKTNSVKTATNLPESANIRNTLISALHELRRSSGKLEGEKFITRFISLIRQVPVVKAQNSSLVGEDMVCLYGSLIYILGLIQERSELSLQDWASRYLDDHVAYWINQILSLIAPV